MAAGMGLTGKIYWGDLLSGQHSLHIKECSDFTPPPHDCQHIQLAMPIGWHGTETAPQCSGLLESHQNFSLDVYNFLTYSLQNRHGVMFGKCLGNLVYAQKVQKEPKMVNHFMQRHRTTLYFQLQQQLQFVPMPIFMSVCLLNIKLRVCFVKSMCGQEYVWTDQHTVKMKQPNMKFRVYSFWLNIFVPSSMLKSLCLILFDNLIFF